MNYMYTAILKVSISLEFLKQLGPLLRLPWLYHRSPKKGLCHPTPHWGRDDYQSHSDRRNGSQESRDYRVYGSYDYGNDSDRYGSPSDLRAPRVPLGPQAVCWISDRRPKILSGKSFWGLCLEISDHLPILPEDFNCNLRILEILEIGTRQVEDFWCPYHRSWWIMQPHSHLAWSAWRVCPPRIRWRSLRLENSQATH